MQNTWIVYSSITIYSVLIRAMQLWILLINTLFVTQYQSMRMFYLLFRIFWECCPVFLIPLLIWSVLVNTWRGSPLPSWCLYSLNLHFILCISVYFQLVYVSSWMLGERKTYSSDPPISALLICQTIWLCLSAESQLKCQYSR